MNTATALDREAAEPGNIVASSPEARIAAECPPEEWAVRVELAAAYRLLDHLGMTDLIHTHLSARVPGEPEHFLMLPYGHLFGEARASQLVKVDPEGGIIADPTGLGISRGGFCIHAVLHLARGEAAAGVMHAHTEATIAVANYRAGLLPLSQHALRFCGKIAFLDYCGTFNTAEKRAALPRALGEADVLVLRNHGPLVGQKCARGLLAALIPRARLPDACRQPVAMHRPRRNSAILARRNARRWRAPSRGAMRSSIASGARYIACSSGPIRASTPSGAALRRPA